MVTPLSDDDETGSGVGIGIAVVLPLIVVVGAVHTPLTAILAGVMFTDVVVIEMPDEVDYKKDVCSMS